MRHHRKEKIASLIKNVVSEEISFRLHDPRVAPFTSVTRVEVASDLAIAEVFISVAGSAADERKTLIAVQHAAGRIQRTLASVLQIRQCPRLRFAVDESVKGVRDTMRVLDGNRRDREQREALQAQERSESESEPDVNDDFGGGAPADAPPGDANE